MAIQIKIIISKELGHLFGRMELDTMDIGLIIKHKVKEESYIQMAMSTLDNGNKINLMEKANIIILMEVNIQDTG